ncbi:MAG: mechanosensitive ion channel family protein [Gammaproteobacteria bacterium]
MRKGIPSIVLGLALAPVTHAQAPADAEATLASRAVMTGEQVIHILDETVDWYRMLGVQQQSATQPSDLLILYANRQSADRVVGLAFEVARANADLLSSQAELKQDDAPDPSVTNQKALDTRRRAIQAEMAAAQKQLGESQPPARAALQATLAELQSELDLLNARRNLLNTMIELAQETDANGSGVSALKEHINAIAASIPAATAGATPMAGVPDGQDGMMLTTVAVPQPTADQGATGRPGIWDLASTVFRLQGKLATIDDVDQRTEALAKTFANTRALPDQQLKVLSARGDAMAARTSGADAAGTKKARDEYDTLAWLFKQTASTLVPLTKAGVLLDQYRNNLDNWRDATRSQYRSALLTLATRVGLLLLLLAVVFGAGELWRRAVFKYVHEMRRRHQLMLVRRIVMAVVAVTIVGVTFATEASSLATFAGLLSAGVAVAMQSVLVSIVGYFFLVGKYGLRVGDRVQIGGVTGDVIDLGLVRLHMLELGPDYAATGRVVAFANSVVFQAAGGIFKQIPGVSIAWREVTLSVPASSDYRAVKQQLLDTANSVLEKYREELDRQTRELRKTSSSSGADEAHANVQLKFSSGSIQAIVRYAVPLARVSEVEERMSRKLNDVIRESAAHPAAITAQRGE